MSDSSLKEKHGDNLIDAFLGKAVVFLLGLSATVAVGLVYATTARIKRGAIEESRSKLESFMADAEEALMVRRFDKADDLLQQAEVAVPGNERCKKLRASVKAARAEHEAAELLTSGRYAIDHADPSQAIDCLSRYLNHPSANEKLATEKLLEELRLSQSRESIESALQSMDDEELASFSENGMLPDSIAIYDSGVRALFKANLRGHVADEQKRRDELQLLRKIADERQLADERRNAAEQARLANENRERLNELARAEQEAAEERARKARSDAARLREEEEREAEEGQAALEKFIRANQKDVAERMLRWRDAQSAGAKRRADTAGTVLVAAVMSYSDYRGGHPEKLPELRRFLEQITPLNPDVEDLLLKSPVGELTQKIDGNYMSYEEVWAECQRLKHGLK